MPRSPTFSAVHLLLLLAFATAGCEGGSTATAVDVQVVDRNAENPVSDFGRGTLEVRVDQGVDHTFLQSVAVSGGTFDLALQIDSYVTVTRIQATITRDGEDAPALIGAVPRFYPFEAGFVRVVMGEPGTCSTLANPTLSTSRLDAALVPHGVDTNFFIVGGYTTAAPDAPGNAALGRLGSILLTWDEGFSDAVDEPLSVRLRETHALRLSSNVLLIVGTGASGDSVLLYDPATTDAPEADVTGAHLGAGARSALVDLGDDGAAIVGGELGGERVGAITWIDADGRVLRGGDGAPRSTRLVTPRHDPIAIAVGGGVLIAGGQAEGQPLFEFAPLRSDGVGVPGPTELRDGAIFVRDPNHGTALLLGGLDAMGAVRTDTLVVTGCPACTLATGPGWPRARLGVAIAETGRATMLSGGTDDGVASPLIDRVVLIGASPSIEDFVSDLDPPRARATAAHLSSGIIVIVGGMDEGNDPIRDVSICWPRALEPLE